MNKHEHANDSIRPDLLALSSRRGKGWIAFISAVLLGLHWIADPPRERSLRSDIYILF